MTFVLTGLDIEAKAELVRTQLEAALTVKPAELEWTLARTDHPDADTEEAASALLRCVVRDPDPANGRTPVLLRPQSNWRWPAIRASPSPPRPATARCTGCSPPASSTPTQVPHIAVHADGTRIEIPPATDTLELGPAPIAAAAGAAARRPDPAGAAGPIAGARSGDKGGSANVGVWVRTDEQWRWLAHTLTVELLKELLPETADLDVTRHVLPNLRAVNFVIEGILGPGRRLPGAVRPAGQGAGRMAAQPPCRHPGRALA